MKVLWFSNSPGAAYANTLKGTGGWIAALDKALQQKIELHIAYKYPYKQPPFMKDKTCYHPIYTGNIVIENLKHRFFPHSHKNLINEYLNIIDKVKPDVIHIHGSENDFHCIVDSTNIPIVLSIQGNPTVIAHRYCSGFYGKYKTSKTVNLSFKSMIFGRKSFQSGLDDLKWMSKLEQKNLPNIKNIIGRTDWDRRISRVLAPKSRYFVVNEAMRDEFYSHVWQMNAPDSKLIIHTTSSGSYFKGFETLCQALHLLNNLGICVEWRVAGVSENSTINKITKKHLGKNYPKKGLVLMGSLNEDDLINSLLTSHLYVMPSHIENSPNSLCEAMLLGMPCITTLAGGSDSILINKKEGLIIQDGDPWSMSGAILELMNNWNQSMVYGREARKHALERHNKEDIVASLIQAYQEIVNTPSDDKALL